MLLSRITKMLSTSLLAAVVVGCTSMDEQRSKYPDPNDRLNSMLILNNIARDGGSACKEVWKANRATTDCDRILREVERLNVEFPHNRRVLMANAVLNYEAGNIAKSAHILDNLLNQQGSQPEAASLRAKIALEEGNSRLALDVLEREIRLAPDHAQLRETQAAALYLSGDYQKARTALSIAGRMGSPGWRLSYHHGLICESEEKWRQACDFYATALEQKAEYRPALARLTGLTEHAECRNPKYFNYMQSNARTEANEQFGQARPRPRPPEYYPSVQQKRFILH